MRFLDLDALNLARWVVEIEQSADEMTASARRLENARPAGADRA